MRANYRLWRRNVKGKLDARFQAVGPLGEKSRRYAAAATARSITRLENGRVQICVAKPQSSPTPGQTYPSSEAARRVLFNFGLDEKDIDATLKLLPVVGPNQPLTFSGRNVRHKVWKDHGFKLG